MFLCLQVASLTFLPEGVFITRSFLAQNCFTFYFRPKKQHHFGVFMALEINILLAPEISEVVLILGPETDVFWSFLELLYCFVGYFWNFCFVYLILKQTSI